MAKNKKEQTNKANIIQTDTVLSNNQSLGYEGKVKIKVMHGKRVISTKEYHNKGRANLFKFLALALTGNYTKNLMPCKVKLFTITDTSITPANFVWAGDSKTGRTQVTPFIYFDTTPALNKENDSTNAENDYYSVTYHFRIPNAYITGEKAYLAAIYPDNETDNINASAYYLFTKETTTTTTTDSTTTTTTTTTWDPLDFSEAGGDFSIIVEWTMSINNK